MEEGQRHQGGHRRECSWDRCSVIPGARLCSQHDSARRRRGGGSRGLHEHGWRWSRQHQEGTSPPDDRNARRGSSPGKGAAVLQDRAHRRRGRPRCVGANGLISSFLCDLEYSDRANTNVLDCAPRLPRVICEILTEGCGSVGFAVAFELRACHNYVASVLFRLAHRAVLLAISSSTGMKWLKQSDNEHSTLDKYLVRQWWSRWGEKCRAYV